MRRPAIDLSGRTDLMTLAAVLRRCRLFVGNDGGVMHLATAVGAPLVAVFGPSNAAAWGPWRPSGTPPAVVVGAPCPRSGPCLYSGHSLGDRDGCPTRECLTELHPDEVMRVVERLGVL
jgi:ADP-heptose:LPS heptosyltransferase